MNHDVQRWNLIKRCNFLCDLKNLMCFFFLNKTLLKNKAEKIMKWRK